MREKSGREKEKEEKKNAVSDLRLGVGEGRRMEGTKVFGQTSFLCLSRPLCFPSCNEESNNKKQNKNIFTANTAIASRAIVS